MRWSQGKVELWCRLFFSRRIEIFVPIISPPALPASALDADTDDDEPSFNDVERETTAYNYTLFHIIFAFAAMYVAMLLTDWNTVTPAPLNEPDDDGRLVMLGQSMVAVWVKAISAWVCIGLYVWTLVVPVLFPERFPIRI